MNQDEKPDITEILEAEERKNEERRIWRESISSISLGWELAIPIFAGVISGQLLDRFLGTTYIFTLGLLLLGIISGYYNVGKAIQRVKQDKKGEVKYIKFEEEIIEDDDDVDEEW